MRKRLWLASPVLAFTLLASTASAEEIALPTEQATLTQTPELVPVKFGTHTVEFIEDDRSFSSTATQTASSWAQVSDAVFKAVKNYEPQLQIKISMKDATSEQITKALKDGFGKSEYTYGIGIDTAMSVSPAGILTFKFTYPVSIEKEQAITKYVKDTAANIFNDQMTDFQKVRAAYEYIITNTNYSIAPEEDGGGHSIYSIVKDGIGVCQAYALLFQRLMEEEGIASKYIVGVASGINHAWNVVTLNGKTYHIDVTYGDPVFQEYVIKNGIVDQNSVKEVSMPQYVTYNTFLMSEEQLAQNAGHVITEERPYMKPSSNDFAAWHNITNAVTLDGKHYYYQNENTYKLQLADFTQPTLTPIALPIDTVEVSQVENLVAFNDRIFFINAYKELSQITKDGTISVVTEGYKQGYSSNTQAGYIAVTKDELKVYALEATLNSDKTAYENAHFYSTKKLIYQEKNMTPIPELPVEPEPVDPGQSGNGGSTNPGESTETDNPQQPGDGGSNTGGNDSGNTGDGSSNTSGNDSGNTGDGSSNTGGNDSSNTGNGESNTDGSGSDQPGDGGTTEPTIDELFAPNSVFLNKINAAVSEKAFKELLTELEKYANAQTSNTELQQVQAKLKGYKAVQTMKENAQQFKKDGALVSFKDVNQKKSWSITFSTPLSTSVSNEIQIVDIFGEDVDAKPGLSSDNTILTITPLEDYVSGADYFVVIPAGTQSVDGEKLAETVYVPFSFK